MLEIFKAAIGNAARENYPGHLGYRRSTVDPSGYRQSYTYGVAELQHRHNGNEHGIRP